MDLLFTVDENYFLPLTILLTSIKEQEPKTEVTVWLLHRKIPDEKLTQLSERCVKYQWNFRPIKVDLAKLAGLNNRSVYPIETYFRLVSYLFLPSEVKKILYLDPDILAIQPIDGLFDLNLEGKVFAAAPNRFRPADPARLQVETYYNSGVLLIDLVKARQVVDLDAIKEQTNQKIELKLADQDVLNLLYRKQVFPLVEEKWNFDVVNASSYPLSSYEFKEHVKLLHFQDRPKPWEEQYQGPLKELYRKYYEKALVI